MLWPQEPKPARSGDVRRRDDQPTGAEATGLDPAAMAWDLAMTRSVNSVIELSLDVRSGFAG
jgi:hypothetical protein